MHRRLRSHGVTNLCSADDQKLISGRAWGMFAEPSAHAENIELALEAGCGYEQIMNEKADGRFFDPLTRYTLLTVQIKHSSKGSFMTSRDGGTDGGKKKYHVTDATHFQFRESCTSCRSLFVELRSFTLDKDGFVDQKKSVVDHESGTFRDQRKKRQALKPTDLVQVLKTRLFFARASLET